MYNTTIAVQCYKSTYDYVLSDWHGIAYILLTIGYGLVFIPTIVLNLAAIKVFFTRRKASSLLILNTAIADCLTGLAQPLGFFHLLLLLIQKRVYCLLYAATAFVGYSACVMSFIMVFIASVDRYLAIFYPFTYAKRNWKRMYKILNIFSWIFTLTLVSSSFTYSLFKPTFYFLAAQPLIIILDCCMLTRIWWTIKKARGVELNQLRIQSSSGEPSPIFVKKKIGPEKDLKNEVVTIHQDCNEKPRRKTGTTKFSVDYRLDAYLTQLRIHHQRKILKKGEQKTNRLVWFMLLSVCTCYLPYFLIIIWWILNKDYTITSQTLGSIAMFFVPLKALLNPIIYLYSMPSIRPLMKKSLLCKTIDSKNASSTSNAIF